VTSRSSAPRKGDHRPHQGPVAGRVASPMPWDRQPGESRRAFGLFMVFLSLGPSGTLAGVRAEMQRRAGSDPRSRVPTMSALYELSRPRQQRGTDGQGRTRTRGHDWTRRASAWFEEQDREEWTRQAPALPTKSAATRRRDRKWERLIRMFLEELEEFASDPDLKNLDSKVKALLRKNKVKVNREVQQILDRYKREYGGQGGGGA